ncbi:MAG TPA: metallophosphoesterase [bacterium]|jgi:sphingomyelin phosphodiesterase acid-like 3|nr:metallophosphoesterase [bacterium]
MRGLILTLSACLAFSSPCAAGVNRDLGWKVRAAGGQGAYLLLSDIHFDPFVDPSLFPKLQASPADQWDAVFAHGRRTKFPSYGDDTNWPLWRSALKALALPGLRYDYALITGDYLAHSFDRKFADLKGGDQKAYAAFVLKTETYVIRSLAKALPGCPLYWVLGNNDSDCGDYAVDDSELASLAKLWTASSGDPAAAADFARGGYYEASLPGKAGRLIALDSVLWSRRYSDGCADPGAAQKELDWLKARLEADARAGRTVTLATHIPPGTNAFKAQCGLPVEAFLKPEYQAQLLPLLREYAPGIRFFFAGHTHFDDLKVLSDRGRAVLGLHIIPSIGPNHGNNPSFQVGLYRRADGGLLDLATYTLKNLERADANGNPGDWELEYGFKQAYGRDFGTAGVAEASQEIRDDESVRARYEAYFTCETSSKAALKSKRWRAYSCAQTCFSLDEFYSCACGDDAP